MSELATIRPYLLKGDARPFDLSTVRALGVKDIAALLALPRPTRVRLVVFHARRFGKILAVHDLRSREQAFARAETISGLPTAVIVDGPDPDDARAAAIECVNRWQWPR